MTSKTLQLLLLLLLIAIPGWLTIAMAQTVPMQKKQVVQLSGRVVSADSLIGMEGVAVYVPGTTRGAHTRQNGYFSLPVLAGDSVVIGALGYHKHYVKIPAEFESKTYTVIIELEENARALPTVDVMPWATEYDLRQAILKVKLPEEPGDKRPVVPAPVAYKTIRDIPAMDASANFRYGQQQLRQGRESRYRAPDVVTLFGIPIR